MDSLVLPPAYARALVEEVLDRTGYPLVLASADGLAFDSEVRIARGGRPYHAVTFREEYVAHALHFLVNGAVKILRTWETPAEKRYLAVRSEPRALPYPDHEELAAKIGGQCHPDQLAAMSRFLADGLVRQVTSFPVDLRTEADIAEHHPEHHAHQNAYLRRQVADFLPTLDERMLDVIPEHPYRASAAMNIAFAEEAARIAGAEPPPPYRRHRLRPVAEDLLHSLHDGVAHGYPGDRQVTDRWASALDLQSWFQWRTVEEL